MDVSINPDVKDVRVLSFEDRHDCMKCLTVLRQWPQMAAVELSMGAVPSSVVEQEIRCVFAHEPSLACAAVLVVVVQFEAQADSSVCRADRLLLMPSVSKSIAVVAPLTKQAGRQIRGGGGMQNAVLFMMSCQQSFMLGLLPALSCCPAVAACYCCPFLPTGTATCAR
jgi:hypothetical protein